MVLLLEKDHLNRIEKKKLRRSAKRKEKLVSDGRMVLARKISLQNRSLFERKSSNKRK